jgi:hypothetical protein
MCIKVYCRFYGESRISGSECVLLAVGWFAKPQGEMPPSGKPQPVNCLAVNSESYIIGAPSNNHIILEFMFETDADIQTRSSSRDIFVFILGMHRSGTSCLAGSLEQCGLFLGEVRRSGKHNAKGNRELPAAMSLHYQILAASGGFWRHPPHRITVLPQHKQALKKIAAQLAARAPCGLKDPRLLLLMDVWLDVIGSFAVSPILVGTFRHPGAVAQSLVKRNKMSEHEAHTLWLWHNTELVRLHQVYRLPLIEFDLLDAQAYCQTVADLATALELEPNMAHLSEFVSAKLDHNRFLKLPVPAMCQEIYAYLQHHRYQPGDYSKRDLRRQVRDGRQQTAQSLEILQQATQTLKRERRRYAWRRPWDTFKWKRHLWLRPMRRRIGRPNW